MSYTNDMDWGMLAKSLVLAQTEQFKRFNVRTHIEMYGDELAQSGTLAAVGMQGTTARIQYRFGDASKELSHTEQFKPNVRTHIEM
ncbi:hypothetical protein BaRGS_00035862 [Batillaria attramentaria]|uniref:Uncharacterized protein n=1 Tax=Batillaria attramentaria TaxID=370345 RepID=A0ABD0JEV1_9CAEN